MGKSLFPIVAEWKCDNLENDFVVRAKYIEINQLSCKEHGKVFGDRTSCWKCATTDLLKEKVKLICLYVNKCGDFDKCAVILTRNTKLSWKWHRFNFGYNGRQMAISLKAFGSNLADMLASFEGFTTYAITEAELQVAYEKEQNNKILRQL